MYFIHSFTDAGVMVSNTDMPYMSEFPAEDQAAAEAIVVELNQPALQDQLASYRFTFEVAGLELSDGLRVQTDRESQAQLFNSYNQLASGLIPDTDWKGWNGWQVANLAQLKPIAQAVAAHVRGCFRGEKAVSDAIQAAKTVAEVEAIDIIRQFQAAYQVAYDEVMVPA
ncbi:DUF4376 domain-containing protein [Pseudomonas kurunegalensis]|uniref:DUF4376 domain-containing protein n=1 Tax=Pseudomonas kurunegalensis TaxID=485880 RepID=UPI002117E3AE|nr:DUF4376 domain-containing protein [Pseudomonas kurunegalensis]